MKNEDTYLKSITSEDLRNLIRDNELRKKQVKIFYIVDSFDIIEYCFPYRNESNRKEYHYNAIAYDFLFYKYPNKPIVPDEYLAELSSFKFHLKFDTKGAIDVIEDINILLSKKEELNIENDLKYFSENISNFLAIQYDLLNKDSIKRFDEILKNRLHTFNINTSSKKDKEVLLDVFNSAKRSELTSHIFEEYYESISHNFIRYNPTVDESFRQLNNTFKDIIVIDRLIQVNNILSEKFKNKEIDNEYLFLYVSSTKYKSEILFNLPKLLNNLPRIFGKERYNILRNAKQLYLQSLSIDETVKKPLEISSYFLKSSEEVQKSGENIIEIKSSNNNISLEGFLNNFDKSRSITKKEFNLASNLNKFFFNKESLEKAISEIETNSISVSKFKNIIQKIFNSKDLKIKSLSVIEYLQLHTANSEFQERLMNIVVSDNESIINSGKDTVKSNYQHLPILILYKNQSILTKEKWHYLLRIVSNYLSNPNSISTENEKKKFINAYNSIINSINKKTFNSPIETTIIIYYLILLFPNSKKNKKFKSFTDYIENEALLIDRLENVKDVLSYSKHRFEHKVGDGIIKLIKAESKYLLEIDYLLIWLYRRQKKFKKSIHLAEKSIKKNPDEPRILQGIALSILSDVYSDENQIDTKSLIKAEKYLLKSKALFLNLIKHEKDNILIKKSIIAILNSICNLNIQLYKTSENNKYKTKAYDAYEEFIELFKKEIKSEINSFPAFCDTLSWLFVLKSRDQIIQKKLNEATILFNKASDYFKVSSKSGIYNGIPEKKSNLQKALRVLKKEFK